MSPAMRDPYWVDVDRDTIITVTMTSSHCTAYQAWLREMGLHLFLIPDGGSAESPDGVYAIGIRQEAGL
jgi:hypothetical protein